MVRYQVKNTYSRKKKGKPVEAPKTNVYNVYNINVNFISISVSNRSAEAKTETSESEPSDVFEKLIKGPIFNINNKSTSRSPDFSQRQDTATFYKSDAEFSISTDISNHLFKDSKDSDIYTPTWLSPTEYCKVKNKLVKVIKDPKISSQLNVCTKRCVSGKNKTSNRVQKKRVGKPNKVNTKLKSLPCTSSTPNRPIASLKKEPCNVSPILHQHQTPRKDSSQYNNSFMYEEENNREEKQHCVLGVSALIKGLENLGIETPRPKNVAVPVNSVNENRELQKCQSPLSLSQNLPNQKDLPLGLDIGEALNQSLDGTNSSRLSPDVNGCNLDSKEKSGCISEASTASKEEGNEEISSESGVISPKTQGLFSNSPRADLRSNQVVSVITSPASASDAGLSSGSYNNKSSTSDIPSPTCQGISNEHDGESRSSSMISQNNIDFDRSSNIEQESGSLKTENSESTNSISRLNSSLRIIEEISCESNKLIEEKEEHWTLSVQKQNLDCSASLEVTPIRESKILEDEENERSCMKGTNSKVSFAKKLTYESQPLNDLTNTYRCEKVEESYKESITIPYKSEISHYSVKDKFSFQSTELNGTMSKISLEIGKRWRRSLIRQKLPETKFERRLSMQTDTLVKLIKEAGILKDTIDLSRVTCNNSTRFMCSLQEDESSSCNKSPNVPWDSLGFNISIGRLRRIERRRRRNYSNDMFEIPEESSNNSNMNCSERDFCEEESMLKLEDDNTSMSDNFTVNKMDVYETPPILRNNSEAMSAITDRKKSHHYHMKSFGDCSFLPDIDQDEDISFISCVSRLELEDDLNNLNDNDVELLGKVGFLHCCGQKEPVNFNDAFPNSVLKTCQKIGEGVYGEVFMLQRPGEDKSVIKIIPVEGSQMVNGAVQKRFDEVLSELIITEELCLLRKNSLNQTSGFCELKYKFFLQGEYPPKLLALWREFDVKKGSDNECPDMFGPEQLYLALELSHAGEPVESFSFKSPQQALAVFLQTTFTLAVAESELDFEHRDLHVGNVLVQLTSHKYITFTLNSTKFECPTSGAKATIIDYTLSRMTFKGDVLYLDLEKDPELFTAEGDYQFDIYRHMRADLNNNWRDHQPKTNIRWLHYLLDKMTDKIKYKQKKTTKLYHEYMDKMIQLKKIILDFYSAADLALHLVDSYNLISSLIRK